VARRGRKAKTKRRTTRRRRNATKKVSRGIKSQWTKISSGAGILAGLANITGGDMAASSGMPIAMRAKNFSNSLVGRVTGFIPFKDAPGQNVTQQVSIDGMFNKYTGIGLGMLAYSMIPAKLLPHKGKAKTLGKSLFGAGLISGIFAPSGNPHSHNLISTTRAAPMAVSEVAYT
jgi:PAB1-binding protein PBP1